MTIPSDQSAKNLLISMTLVMICAAVWVPLYAQTQPQARHALLIGVNEYPAPSVPNLRGAVNDITTMHALLLEVAGFKETDITVLLDGAATRKAILAAFEQLVQETGPDATIYIHYSGHGSQVQDLDGDESDGMDETIVPHDGRTGEVPDITDDEIAGFLSRVKSKAVVIVLDSCHSGTATRSLAFQTRSVPPDTRLSLYQSGSESAQTRSVVPLESQGHILMTGAASNQSALDGPIGGVQRGFFSFALANALMNEGPQASPIQLYERITELFGQIESDLGTIRLPNPQLEGPNHRMQTPLFPPNFDDPSKPTVSQSGSDSLGPASVTVTPIGSGLVRLASAALMGTRPGAYWAIYPPGEIEFEPGVATGAAVVTEIRGNDAVGRTEPVDLPVPSGSRAVPITRPPPPAQGCSIDLRAEPSLLSEIRQELMSLGSGVSLVGPDLFAHYIVESKRSSPSMIHTAVHGAAGIQEIADFNAGTIAEVTGRLSQLCTRSFLSSAITSLSNPSSSISLDVKVVSAPTKNDGLRGVSVVSSRQRTSYRIRRSGEPRSHANSLMLEISADSNCFLTIVDVDTEGGVIVLFPNDYQNKSFLADGFLSAGRVVRIPDSLQPDNKAGFCWDYSPPEGMDTVQVFASTDRRTAEKIRRFAREVSTATATRGFTAGARAVENLRSDLSRTRGIKVVAADGPTTSSTVHEPASVADWTAVSVNLLVED